MTRLRFTSFGIILIVTLMELANLAHAQMPPVPDRAVREEPDLFGMKKLEFVQKPDDELKWLKVQRYLAAWEQYSFTAPRFRNADISVPEMVQAVRAVVDAQWAITESDADRLRLLEQSVQLWKMVEDFQQTGFREGFIPRSEVAQVKVQHLTAQIAVLEFKRKMEGTKQTQTNPSPGESPAPVSASPTLVGHDVCPAICRPVLRRRRS